MKISKKFKKLSLITLLLSTVFTLNTHNVFGMAEPIKEENPATELMPSSRLDYLIAQIKSNPELQQQLENIGNIREEFLLTALKEACFRHTQALDLCETFGSDRKIAERNRIKKETVKTLQFAENTYFDADSAVQELVDQIELAAQIHHAKEIAHVLKEAQAQFDYKNLKERFTYTIIKDIVSKELLSKEDHLKHLFSKTYFLDFQLVSAAAPFMLSIPYFKFLNKSYNSILGKESTFILETLYKTNPELLHKILTIFKKTRGYNLKLIILEKINQFLATPRSFGNTQQEKCLRRLHENKRQKFAEIQTKIEQNTYSLQELEDQRNLTLEGLPENLCTKVLFLIQCELENQSGELLDKYFDYLKALTNIHDADLLLAKQIDIENLSTLDIEKTIFETWLNEIIKPKLQIAANPEKKAARKAPNKKRSKRPAKKIVKKPGANKPKPIDIQKDSPEAKPVIVDKQAHPSTTISQPQLSDDNLAQITHQISELTLAPEQQYAMQNDTSRQNDYAHSNCIYDLSRGIFNGHQVKLFIYRKKDIPQDTGILLQNLDYNFLEQHGKILRTLDNNHSFSKLVEKDFESFGVIIESKEFTKHEMQSMTKTYGNSLNFEQYKYKITIHIPGKITGLSCSTDFANRPGASGNFEFVILQRNPADPNPLCVHRFFRSLNYVEQPAFA